MAERADGRSEVLEDLQVLLRHGRVFLPVVLRVHVKVWSVALVGDFGNNGRLWEQCEILRGSVCRRTEGKKKKTPTHRYLSHVTGIPGVKNQQVTALTFSFLWGTASQSIVLNHRCFLMSSAPFWRRNAVVPEVNNDWSAGATKYATKCIWRCICQMDFY